MNPDCSYFFKMVSFKIFLSENMEVQRSEIKYSR